MPASTGAFPECGGWDKHGGLPEGPAEENQIMRHDRLAVLTALETQGVAPVFYHPDPQVCLNVIRACARDGRPHAGHHR